MGTKQTFALWRAVAALAAIVALGVDFIPGLWRAADPRFVNNHLASLDGSAALIFTYCALYLTCKSFVVGIRDFVRAPS